MTTRITRRTLLRASGTTALAGLLAACAGDPADDPAAADPSGTTDDPALAAGSGQALTVIIPSREVIVGPEGRLTMGILGEDNRPILDASPVVTITREGEAVASGLEARFYGEGLGDRGIYLVETTLEDPGVHEVVVEIPDVGVGAAAVAAVTPENARAVAPGESFPLLETPTTDDPGPLEVLCTQDPPCSMHERSLDVAMAAGPVVFTVATPQYCQTAVCGPVVSVIERVRDEVGRDDVAFVHVEVYTDAGQTLTPTVDELALPTEPWTWVIDADGVVVDRFEGPVVPDLLAETVRAL